IVKLAQCVVVAGENKQGRTLDDAARQDEGGKPEAGAFRQQHRPAAAEKRTHRHGDAFILARASDAKHRRVDFQQAHQWIIERIRQVGSERNVSLSEGLMQSAHGIEIVPVAAAGFLLPDCHSCWPRYRQSAGAATLFSKRPTPSISTATVSCGLSSRALPAYMWTN